MMGMVTYDGLNGASAQSCKTDQLTVKKGPCLSRQSIAGQIVHVHMRALRDCFTLISMLKASIREGKRKFTPPSFRKECKRQCHEAAAVKL